MVVGGGEVERGGKKKTYATSLKPETRQITVGHIYACVMCRLCLCVVFGQLKF